jgi:amino acid transporter
MYVYRIIYVSILICLVCLYSGHVLIHICVDTVLLVHLSYIQVTVRINPLNTAWGRADLRAIAPLAPDAILIPKVRVGLYVCVYVGVCLCLCGVCVFVCVCVYKAFTWYWKNMALC